MAAYSWLHGVSGDWLNAADWVGGVPNGSAAAVTIATAGTYTVEIATAESFTIDSLNLDNASGTLLVGGTLTVAGFLSLTAGTLDLNGTIDGGTIYTKAGLFTVQTGTLTNVIVDGTIALNNVASSLTLIGGLKIKSTTGKGPGEIKLTGVGSSLNVEGSQTLDNATILFGNSASAGVHYAPNDFASLVLVNANSTPATLILGKSLNIVGSHLYAAIFGSSPGYLAPNTTIVNNGKISATAKGGQFYIGAFLSSSGAQPLKGGAGAFTNNGAVSVSNGDTLTIEPTVFINSAAGTLTAGAGSTLNVGWTGGSWSNAGTVTATGATVNLNGTWTNTGAVYVANSTVNLSGAFTGAALNQFDGKGNTIAIAGTVAIANAGDVLLVGATSGLGHIVLNSGTTITGGTIADAGGGMSFDGGTLDGVTYQGVMDLRARKGIIESGLAR
jgi:hypothetical protein